LYMMPVLLAVLMIEAGGGLSLAVGMALQEPVRGFVAASLSIPAGHPGQRRRPRWTPYRPRRRTPPGHLRT
jgi:hypothetical protein